MEMQFKFDNLTADQLDQLAAAVAAEKEKRKKSRFNELTTAAADALNALVKEFPFVSFNIDYECYECNCVDTVNLFDTVTHFDASYFHP